MSAINSEPRWMRFQSWTARRPLKASSLSVSSGPDSEDQGESWINYLQRTADYIDNFLQSTSSEDWVDLRRKRKLHFAGMTARKTDNRWSTRLLSWQPQLRLSLRRMGRRDCPDHRWKLARIRSGCWLLAVSHWMMY